ncbi:HEAT repeats [uncultured archaeon]|nr:HEAT repeats [uncultured archaeon]
MPFDHTDLKEMKRSGDVEGLLCILEAGDVKEVREAVRILGELRYRKAIRPLVGLLEKDDIQVRANSAWSLGEIGDVKAVLPLIGLLNDPSENVQIYAAWALGRIGDKRAITALESMLESGSTEVRKHAREAIDRIESSVDGKKNRGNGNYRGEEDRVSSSDPDIPLVTLDVPMDRLDCDYITRAEGNSKTGKVKFSGDVAVKDIINANQKSTRRVVLGLKNDFSGLVSVDILLRYRDSEGDTSSVWMRVATPGGSPAVSGGEAARARETGEQAGETGRKTHHGDFKRARIKPGRKQAPRHVDYEVAEDARDEPEREEVEEEQPYPEDFVPEEYPERRAFKRKETARHDAVPDETEPDSGADDDIRMEAQPVVRKRSQPEKAEPEVAKARVAKPELKVQAITPVREEPEIPEPKPVKAEPKIQETRPVTKEPEIEPAKPEPKVEDVKPPASKAQEIKPVKAEPKVQEPKVQETKPVKAEPKIQEVTLPKPEPKVTEIKTAKTEPKVDEFKPLKPEQRVVEIKPQPQAVKVIEKTQATPPPAKAVENVDSAVRLLSDIGMSGMTEAASAVTQLGGEEADSLQSRLRTLPIDQMSEEIISLGEYIASVEVNLHGKSESGEMNGTMIMFFPKDVALSIANELLCNQPNALVKEFTEDITSTLKETANIFGGQYVSAISEYIGMPILLKAPTFKTGASSQVAESMMKDISGKVDFALATDLTFGNNKTGRLVMLLDPKSYDIIITKLF